MRFDQADKPYVGAGQPNIKPAMEALLLTPPQTTSPPPAIAMTPALWFVAEVASSPTPTLRTAVVAAVLARVGNLVAAECVSSVLGFGLGDSRFL